MVGDLWYSTGLLQSNATIVWEASAKYQSGTLPSIAIAGPDVLEVHQGKTGTLWSLDGQF